VAITLDKRSKESRGWGTVTFATPEEAAAAVEALSDLKIEDRAIRVEIRRGPRVRRRRQPPADAEPATEEGEEKPRRRRRPPFRRRFVRRRRPGQEGTDAETPAQEAKGDSEENKPRPRRRQRRSEKKEEGTVAVHLPPEADAKEEGEEGDKPRRRRRRNNRDRPAGGEGAPAKEEAAPRERKQPEVVANPDCHLYVRNVHWDASADDLKAFFEQHVGPVTSAKITMTTKGLSRGWGTVEMGSPDDAKKALELKETFMERELVVRPDRRVRGAE